MATGVAYQSTWKCIAIERPTKLTETALKKIDDAMSQDDETTAKELVATLQGAGVKS